MDAHGPSCSEAEQVPPVRGASSGPRRLVAVALALLGPGALAEALSPVSVGTGSPVPALAPTWERHAAPGLNIEFPGLTDAAGNLYWLECDDASACEAVSVTRDGVERWRRAGTALFGGMLQDAMVIFLGRGPLNADNCFADASIVALHDGDGSAAWTVSLRETLATLSGDPSEPCSTVASTTAAEGGRVWVPWNAFRTHLADGVFSRLVAFDLETGELIAAIPPPVPAGFVSAIWAGGVAVDGEVGRTRGHRERRHARRRDDTIYASQFAARSDGSGQSFLAALGAGGGLRWLAPDDPPADVLAVDRALYESSRDAFFTAGSTLGVRSVAGDLALAPAPLFSALATVADLRVTSVGCPRPTGDIYCMTELNVYAHDRALASLMWQLPVGRDTLSHEDGEGGFDFTTPIVTRTGTAVMALRARGPSGGPASQVRLLEIALADGSLRGRARPRPGLPAGGAEQGALYRGVLCRRRVGDPLLRPARARAGGAGLDHGGGEHVARPPQALTGSLASWRRSLRLTRSAGP